jgi:hypothetical protein
MSNPNGEERITNLDAFGSVQHQIEDIISQYLFIAIPG